MGQATSVAESEAAAAQARAGRSVQLQSCTQEGPREKGGGREEGVDGEEGGRGH